MARAEGVAIEPASPMPFAPKGLHDGQRPGTLRGGADIHAAHLGMRSRGADDREIRHLRQDNIVNVTRLSTQKTWGLAPPHHPRHPSCRRLVPHFHSPRPKMGVT